MICEFHTGRPFRHANLEPNKAQVSGVRTGAHMQAGVGDPMERRDSSTISLVLCTSIFMVSPHPAFRVPSALGWGLMKFSGQQVLSDAKSSPRRASFFTSGKP